MAVNIVGTSRKLCPDELMKQERRYLAALQAVRDYEFSERSRIRISYSVGEASGLMIFEASDPS